MQQLTQKRGKIRLLDAAPQFRPRRSDGVQRLGELDQQLQAVVGTAVGQPALGKRPDALVGIELRRVGREMLDMEPRMSPPQLTQRISLVGCRVVQQHDHVPGQVPQERAQEPTDLDLPDVGQVQVVEEAQALATRADGDAGDDRDLVAPIAMAVDRRLTARRPGAQDGGDQEESRLVDEDEVGTQPRSFFFIRGHSRRFQRSIATSSRSMARRSGF